MSETLQKGELVFEVRRSARRKTLGLTVDRGGELIAHAPETASPDELEGWICKKLLWVHRRLALKEKTAPKPRKPEYVTGESFSYLGRRYRLKISTVQKEPLYFDGKQFLLRPDVRPADDHFRRWYLLTGSVWLRTRVESLIRRTGTAPSRIDVRDLGFHWGSCSRNGAVMLNWKTLQLSVRLVDYVIIHELIHLREPHHRPEFYRALECALPDWKEREGQLKTIAQNVYW